MVFKPLQRSTVVADNGADDDRDHIAIMMVENPRTPATARTLAARTLI